MPERAVVAWLRLARVYQRINRASTALLRRWGLSLAQFDVIARVGAAPGISQQRLAATLLVTAGDVCQLLDRLEQRGVIERRPAGRAHRLFLTPAGQRLYAEVIPAQESLLTRLFQTLAPAEQRQLSALLRRLERALVTSPSTAKESPHA